MREIPPEVTLVATMELHTTTMSLNRIHRMLRGKGSHRYTKHKAELYQWVMAGRANGNVTKAEGRRHLHVVRTFKSERFRLDTDNFIGGCKPLIDACTHFGIIVGDEDRNATVSYEQARNTTADRDWMVVNVYDYPVNKRAPLFAVGDKVLYNPTGVPPLFEAVVSARKLDMALGEWVYWLDEKPGEVGEQSLSRRSS